MLHTGGNNILTIKCAKCKAKIMKYKKIGQGKVLCCWGDKIKKMYGHIRDEKLLCSNCDNLIGEIRSKGHRNYVSMNRDQFTYSGTKIRK